MREQIIVDIEAPHHKHHHEHGEAPHHKHHHEHGEASHHKHHHEHGEEDQKRRRGCRPLAFLLGFPFALCSLLLSLAGGIVWILGSTLSYVCPALSCCADLANTAMDLIKFPINVFTWFIDKIPC